MPRNPCVTLFTSLLGIALAGAGVWAWNNYQASAGFLNDAVDGWCKLLEPEYKQGGETCFRSFKDVWRNVPCHVHMVVMLNDQPVEAPWELWITFEEQDPACQELNMRRRLAPVVQAEPTQGRCKELVEKYASLKDGFDCSFRLQEGPLGGKLGLTDQGVMAMKKEEMRSFTSLWYVIAVTCFVACMPILLYAACGPPRFERSRPASRRLGHHELDESSDSADEGGCS
eukprot:gnl/MRDRNA2_/MRDRNA2_96493_c0_seq1.p1 gnl/MRDRNA2_/MRDRNA2_96493_c0~~gnl/MRDRNA2_/MRDRNA2_96493_c0_seq1.p1  ORF type:complete len:228 (+),score=38.83 gnl/MRDRNA2_/MRDRNA2_96493_c0_seq1:73-756(+)